MSNLAMVPPSSAAPKDSLTALCCAPITTAELSAPDAERIATVFKALSDPVRLRLFSRVASHPAGEACVCDIADVGVSQPTVSHHLKKLREAGLLTSERRRTWVYYRVAPEILKAVATLLVLPVAGESDDAAHP